MLEDTATTEETLPNEEAEIDKFCNNDSCEVPSLTGDNDDQEYAN